MKVLIVAYKIEKDKGSEDGPSYNVIQRLLRLGFEITLVTRSNNVDLLRNDRLYRGVKLIGVDVPKWLSFYKKKGRGIIAYYYIWQIIVGRLVKKLQEVEEFDVIHQFNFHADWSPHFLSNPNGLMIWGPIMHHDPVPFAFIRTNKLRGVFGEIVKQVVKNAFWRFDPFLKSAADRTNVILYANSKVARPFLKHKRKIQFMPVASSIESLRSPPGVSERFRILSVGRLVALKGFELTVDAFANFVKRFPSADAELTIVGSGELEFAMKRKVDAFSLEDRVRFVPWVRQEELAEYYKGSSVFLYPSFESQGLVVAEAMGASLPIICLDNTGPSFLCGDAGLKIPISSYGDTVEKLAEALGVIFQEYSYNRSNSAYTKRCERSEEIYKSRLDWDVMAEKLAGIYENQR